MYFGVIRRQEGQSSLLVCMNRRIVWADCSQSDDTPAWRVLEDGSVVGVECALRYWDLVAEVKLAFRQNSEETVLDGFTKGLGRLATCPTGFMALCPSG